MGNINLIPFEDKEDNYLLMHNWCSKDYVCQWFEQRKLTQEEITEKYKRKLSENKQKLFFIYLDDKPIGYTQIYEYSDEEFELPGNFESVYEFDIFIGEEKFLSKGLGMAAVKIICGQIFQEYRADCIVLRPFEGNERARHCYEQAGFKLLGKYSGEDTLGNIKMVCVYYKGKGEGYLRKRHPYTACSLCFLFCLF